MPNYNSRTPVKLSDDRKMAELAAMQEICSQFPIVGYGFRPGNFNPTHEVLAVEFVAFYEQNHLQFIVDICPSTKFPYEEPAAILVWPDITDLTAKDGKRLHVYTDFGNRLICGHLSQWHPRCSLAKFFLNTVWPWAANFTAFVLSDGLWHPENWFTSQRERSTQ